jgi:hypothetical protein
MITVDKLLLDIVNNTNPTLEDLMSARDSRVLRSLATSVNSNYFITENQSKLILKLFKEHVLSLQTVWHDISNIMVDPEWSRSFRQVEEYKKLQLSKNIDGDTFLSINFSYSANIRKVLQTNSNKIDGFVQVHPAKGYTATLTEHNIMLLVDLLSPLKFEIDEDIINYATIIKSWDKKEVKGRFDITNISNQNFHKSITGELGIETTINNLIIKDRSFRYQYTFNNTEVNPATLAGDLAYRDTAKVWVDSEVHSLQQVISALIELRRTPILVVFPNWDVDTVYKNMLILDTALRENKVNSNVGMYFRMDNQGVGKEFNQLISNNKYNAQLDDNTVVVGIQASKIPKFLLKNKWTPMSVIVLDTIRNNKSMVYANCCDLIISYTNTKPVLDLKANYVS